MFPESRILNLSSNYVITQRGHHPRSQTYTFVFTLVLIVGDSKHAASAFASTDAKIGNK